MFLNDIEGHLVSDSAEKISIECEKVFILLYADDTVILADNTQDPNVTKFKELTKHEDEVIFKQLSVFFFVFFLLFFCLFVLFFVLFCFVWFL